MDPLLGAAIVGGVGSLLGGGVSSAANAREAQRNREFQERMSNTQYQRAVRDMRRAGLNPALAYQQGGAGNVGGSTMDVSQFGEGIRDATSRSLAAASARQELEKQRHEVDKAKAEAVGSARQVALLDYELIRQRWLMGNADYDRPPDADSAFAADIRRQIAVSRAAQLSNSELRAMSRMWERLGEQGKTAQFLWPFISQLLRR